MNLDRRLSLASSACSSLRDIEQLPVESQKSDPLFGTRIRREFDGQVVWGQVTAVDKDLRTGERAYLVSHEDGDQEHLSEQEIRACVPEFACAAPYAPAPRWPSSPLPFPRFGCLLWSSPKPAPPEPTAIPAPPRLSRAIGAPTSAPQRNAISSVAVKDVLLEFAFAMKSQSKTAAKFLVRELNRKPIVTAATAVAMLILVCAILFSHLSTSSVEALPNIDLAEVATTNAASLSSEEIEEITPLSLQAFETNFAPEVQNPPVLEGIFVAAKVPEPEFAEQAVGRPSIDVGLQTISADVGFRHDAFADMKDNTIDAPPAIDQSYMFYQNSDLKPHFAVNNLAGSLGEASWSLGDQFAASHSDGDLELMTDYIPAVFILLALAVLCWLVRNCTESPSYGGSVSAPLPCAANVAGYAAPSTPVRQMQCPSTPLACFAAPETPSCLVAPVPSTPWVLKENCAFAANQDFGCALPPIPEFAPTPAKDDGWPQIQVGECYVASIETGYIVVEIVGPGLSPSEVAVHPYVCKANRGKLSWRRQDKRRFSSGGEVMDVSSLIRRYGPFTVKGGNVPPEISTLFQKQENQTQLSMHVKAEVPQTPIGSVYNAKPPTTASKRIAMVEPRFRYIASLRKLADMGYADTPDLRDLITSCQGQVPLVLNQVGW